MNRNDFIKLIRDPAAIDRQMTGEIRELLDLFPWFQSAHLLLLKGLHNTGDVKFENQLRLSAVHLPDREVLYYMLYNPLIRSVAATVTNEPEPVLQPEQPDNEQVVIESAKNSSDLIQELEKTAAVLPPDTGAGAGEVAAAHEMIVVTNESEIDESASVMLVIEDGESHIEETVTFMDPSISVPGEDELLEIEENVIELASEMKAAVEEKPAAVPEPANRREMQARLIDEFILLNPRIEPTREKTDRPNEDISKQFTEENGGFLTETLARIYVNQGYYSRAIEIYEKLSLKYPEKSSYFATQIEKVKALIK